MSWTPFADLKKLSIYTAEMTQQAYADAVLSGEDVLIDLVGQEAVEDTKLTEPADQTRAAKLVRAHSYLAIAHYVPNARILKKQQDAASPTGGGNTITNEYFTPKELLGIAESYQAMAEKAAKDYIIGDEPGEPGYVQPSYSSSVDIEFGW